jgi:hypothetical protein
MLTTGRKIFDCERISQKASMTPSKAYFKCLEDNKRDEQAEKIIIKDPQYAHYYALNIIKGRWKQAEPIIIINSSWAYYYAKEIIKDRWIEAEETIKNSQYAYAYAKDVIKGRWIEAENIIAINSHYAYYYATDVIKGKLPENMHNMMLIHADHHAKLYFDYIKNNHHL